MDVLHNIVYIYKSKINTLLCKIYIIFWMIYSALYCIQTEFCKTTLFCGNVHYVMQYHIHYVLQDINYVVEDIHCVVQDMHYVVRVPLMSNLKSKTLTQSCMVFLADTMLSFGW